MNRLTSAILHLSVIALLCTGLTACDSGTDDDDEREVVKRSTVSGVVREAETKVPLPDVSVELNNAQTTTDQSGRYEFTDVRTGPVTLKVGGLRFDAYTQQLQLQEGENHLDISLVRKTYHELDTESNGKFGLYTTPGVSTYRGIILLKIGTGETRGFASGRSYNSPPSDRDKVVAAYREPALMLAEKFGLALIGVADLGRGLEEGTSALLTALGEFGETHGYPEFTHAPVLAIGHSDGGCLAYNIATYFSERTIGFINQNSPCNFFGAPVANRLIPGYLIASENDLGAPPEAVSAVFDENRAQRALWALAIRPNEGHTPVCDMDLLFNWAEDVLEIRLPETVIPGTPVALKAVDEVSGWLGHRTSYTTAAYASYSGDELQASWLPSEKTAADWRALVSGLGSRQTCQDIIGGS